MPGPTDTFTALCVFCYMQAYLAAKETQVRAGGSVGDGGGVAVGDVDAGGGGGGAGGVFGHLYCHGVPANV